MIDAEDIYGIYGAEECERWWTEATREDWYARALLVEDGGRIVGRCLSTTWRGGLRELDGCAESPALVLRDLWRLAGRVPDEVTR